VKNRVSNNIMVTPIAVSSGGQMDVRTVIKDDSKFKDVFEEKKAQVDKSNQTSKAEKSEETEKEEPKIQDEDTKGVDQTQKSSKKQEVQQNNKDDGEKVEDEDQENIKEKEIEKELMELAKALGIDPEKAAQLIMTGNLTSIKDSQETIDILAEELTALAGVGEQEKSGLQESLRGIIKGIISEVDDENYSLGKQEIDAESAKDLMDVKNQEEVKNNQLEKDKTKAEIDNETKQIKNVQDNSEIKNTDKNQNTNKKDSTLENKEIKADDKLEIKDIKKRLDTENEDGNKSEDQKQGDWTDKVKVMFKNQGNSQNTFKSSIDTGVQLIQNFQDMQNDPKVQAKESNFVIPNKDEILNQIVDKAAVTLTPDKAEMVINLKPDNLGKLEMKLATEKGVINAQITAENQEVKQIIESNFNVLKDALEKQGITVQSFSVSVGNQSWNRGYQNSGSKNQNNSQRQYKTDGITVGDLAYLQDVNSNSRIIWPNSTINFTA